MNERDRSRLIIRTGIIGVLVNIILASFKLVVGIVVNSISIISDGINNFSDVLSSTIAIIGIKLANTPPDKEHPFGHGRIEYISAFLISQLILFIGISTAISAIKKIIHPEITRYNIVSIVLLVVAILVKYILSTYTILMAKKVNSDSLKASGKDAFFDALITITILIAAIIQFIAKISIDAYLGFIVSILIIKSGYDMIMDTISNILGKRVGKEVVSLLKNEILTFNQVIGVYDLYLDSYGPNKYAGFVRLEVSDELSASEIDELTRLISLHIYDKYQIIITCGIYAISNSESDIKMKESISKYVMTNYGVLQIHGFNINKNKKIIYFDVVIDFEVVDVKALINKMIKDLTILYGDYNFYIIPDVDFSDAY